MRLPSKKWSCRIVGYGFLWCLGVPAVAEDVIHAQSVLVRLIDQVDVPARAPGVLSSIHFAEGQTISRGALLAQVDDEEARLVEEASGIQLKLARLQTTNDVSVRSAKTFLTFAKTDYTRLKEAADARPQSVSAAELDELKLKIAQAAFELEDASRKLKLTKATLELRENEGRLSRLRVQLREVRAPLTGVVAQVVRRVGEWVEPGDPVMRIVSVDRLRAEAFLRVRDVTGKLDGARVTVHVSTTLAGARDYAGKIVFVHPEIDPVNEQFRVWAEVKNLDGSLRPGMRARMTVRLDPSRTDTQVAP